MSNIKKNKLIKITQLKSTIGCNKNQRLNLLGLGLRGIQSHKVLQDNASVRGMIYEVRHLVCVTEINS
ncbi:50S ribosomal protein L30 [Rickettsiales bacterium Ac37b]|nr:50S ribosomal protein L30 [Rickettsiales bacterium Ac37b]